MFYLFQLLDLLRFKIITQAYSIKWTNFVFKKIFFSLNTMLKTKYAQIFIYNKKIPSHIRSKNMLKRLMAHSFINILDKELKYYAKKSGDYFIYDRWKEKNYASLTSLKINLFKKTRFKFSWTKNSTRCNRIFSKFRRVKFIRKQSYGIT